MKIEFLGGVRTVTGSATLFEKGSLKWLVDCGMFQGGREIEKKNDDTGSYHPRDLSFVLLTHAHIDHSGLIPRLVREGFRGKVVCTKATLDLCEVMLRDSGHIQEMEAEWQNRKNRRSGGKRAAPLYTVKDAEKSLRFFSPVNYNEIISLTDGLKVRFQDAGHILGSAIIELWVEEGGGERKLVFSGDLGNSGQPIVRDPSWVKEADLLWLESTYGNRLHKSREETSQELLKIVQEAIAHQAKVIIPAFAVERTQDIIYTLGQFMREGLIPSIRVYIDSPLAISATEIFKKNSDCFDRETKEILLRGENPLDLPEIIYTRTTEESKAINEDEGPGIIISASGMCDSGRIKHHLKHHLWREKSHIVFIGYQGEGTIGRRIIDGAESVRLFGEVVAIKAHIHTLGGFSAHADQKGLLEWLSHFENPQLEVFVNHGEEKISMELSQLIRERFHLKVSIPQWREKRFLFAPEERPISEEAREEAVAPEETFHILLRHLDRNYKRLRRKLKRWRGMGEEAQDPHRLRQLEEVNRKIEELESELD
ncbi:MAG: MBL fold metallo-hydrolase [Thermodesulfobacteriota bacterium]|nr:MBL fold metallo-hydrolase [Thermodesulfobacteriota bacterium]